MSNATAAKIPASTIVIKRAEGPYDLCVARVFSTDETASCWSKAAAWLSSQCSTFPACGGYDKHDMTVTFADGEIYKGRLDCKADGSDTDPAEHVRDALAFMAGNRCPAHWSPEKYKAHIKENLTAAGEALAFLATYEV